MANPYEVFIDLETQDVVCLAMSTSGSKLVAITGDGNINVWDVAKGKRYHPTPRRALVRDSCISWLDDTTFVCGFADGYLLTAYVHPDGHEELELQQTKISHGTILDVTFNPSTGLLAVGGQDGSVGFWKRGHSQWIYSNALPATSFPRDYGKIASLTWLTEEPDEILIGYRNKGLIIWDSAESSVKRVLEVKPGRNICKGTFCPSIHKYVAVNDLGSVDIYDINSGEFWSPSKLEGVSVVKSINMGTGFIAGGAGKCELVNIVETCIGQTLSEGNDSVITAVDVHQREDGVDMITTASTTSLKIWRPSVQVGSQGTQKLPDSSDYQKVPGQGLRWHDYFSFGRH